MMEDVAANMLAEFPEIEGLIYALVVVYGAAVAFVVTTGIFIHAGAYA